MKGQFIIVDLNTMDFMKNSEGKINYYDTISEAALVCGMYEFPNVWILELKFNHVE